MKASKTLLAVGATLALAAPAANASLERSLPVKTTHAKVVRHHRIVVERPRVSHRVLCICVTGVTLPSAQPSEQELQAQYDQDLIDHGLDPVYNIAAS